MNYRAKQRLLAQLLAIVLLFLFLAVMLVYSDYGKPPKDPTAAPGPTQQQKDRVNMAVEVLFVCGSSLIMLLLSEIGRDLVLRAKPRIYEGLGAARTKARELTESAKGRLRGGGERAVNGAEVNEHFTGDADV